MVDKTVRRDILKAIAEHGPPGSAHTRYDGDAKRSALLNSPKAFGKDDNDLVEQEEVWNDRYRGRLGIASVRNAKRDGPMRAGPPDDERWKSDDPNERAQAWIDMIVGQGDTDISLDDVDPENSSDDVQALARLVASGKSPIKIGATAQQLVETYGVPKDIAQAAASGENMD